MSKKSIYPRGFSVSETSVSNLTTRIPGDAEVSLLFWNLVKGDDNIFDHPYTKSVMRCAVRLIGTDFNRWLVSQRNNEFLHTNAINFLNDTLRYLETGNRSVSVNNWIELLDEKPDPLPRKLTTPVVAEPARELNLNTYLKTWLSKPDGLVDLVFSLYTMYGEEIPSLNLANATPFLSPRNPGLQRLASLLNKKS